MKLFNRIMTAVLGIFSVASCSDNGECMYGTPEAIFEVKGMVTDEDGSPIDNVGVDVYIDTENESYPLGAIATDKEGKYEGRFSVSPDCIRLSLKCHDKEDKYIPVLKKLSVEYDPKIEAPWKMWMYSGTASEKVDFVLKKRD